MGYFDSPKNRALWDIELKELKKEKQERQVHGAPAPGRAQAASREASVYRERTSYKELLAEENAARGFSAPRGRTRAMSMQQEKQRTLSGPAR